MKNLFSQFINKASRSQKKIKILHNPGVMMVQFQKLIFKQYRVVWKKGE